MDWIQLHMRCDFLDFWMPKVSALGNWNLLWFSFAALLLARKSTRRFGIVLIAGLLGVLLVANLGLKNIVARDRPCWINEEVRLLVAVPWDYSFPSGHSAAAFVSATILCGMDKRVGIIAVLLAVLIAFSRLYLYVHFPTDVLGGTLIGIIIGLIVLYVNRRLTKEKDGAG